MGELAQENPGDGKALFWDNTGVAIGDSAISVVDAPRLRHVARQRKEEDHQLTPIPKKVQTDLE